MAPRGEERGVGVGAATGSAVSPVGFILFGPHVVVRVAGDGAANDAAEAAEDDDDDAGELDEGEAAESFAASASNTPASPCNSSPSS